MNLKMCSFYHPFPLCASDLSDFRLCSVDSGRATPNPGVSGDHLRHPQLAWEHGLHQQLPLLQDWSGGIRVRVNTA